MIGSRLTSIELCAGGGGQALGLEQAGFNHIALVELDKYSCATLRHNRPHWNVINRDLHDFEGKGYGEVDLLSAGLPCPPFSVAGKQLGENDERNLFPTAVRLIGEIQPRAVLIENVRGLLDKRFDEFRRDFEQKLQSLGYRGHWKLINACDFGVSQLRPRVTFVALKGQAAARFDWPEHGSRNAKTVGDLLYDLVSVNGWMDAEKWKTTASDIAPTIVGGSLKHGGPDLGPTRARKAWAALGVDGLGIADEAPSKGFKGAPKLTVRMVARIQGFEDTWEFVGGKTAAYRQVGNAFPPPVAQAVGKKIFDCLTSVQQGMELQAV